MDTDAGLGYLKSPNNPMGPASVIAELVCAELGTWFGLNIPPFSIIADSQIELVMSGLRRVEYPSFFSKHIESVMPFDGTDLFLHKLRNSDDIAKLIIFDTWVRNFDRCAPGMRNFDNLLICKPSRKKLYDLVPIDHGQCFVEDGDFIISRYDAIVVRDETIFGVFPPFRGFLTHDSVRRAVTKLQSLDRSFVEDVVASVPAAWGLGPNASASLTDLICDRAAFVVETIAGKIVTSPRLPGVDEND
ncbi:MULTISPECIES: HipA family kinase [Methylosinus]|uniref:HipA family kinase n=1 Tax=Methylosinus TaxID=425 RepID=UPI0012DC8002|nr:MULTISPECIES: HipA family kinase [Methylosinus]